MGDLGELKKSPEKNKKEIFMSSTNTQDNGYLYLEMMSDLWRRVIFCAIGWTIACAGFGIMQSKTLIGLLIVMVGVIIVEIPCFKILLAGGSVTALFASSIKDRVVTTYYSDGTSSTGIDYRGAERATVGLFGWIFTLIIGGFAVVFSIIKDFIMLLILKKDNPSPSFKDKPICPFLAGVLFFIIGIVVGVVLANAIDAGTSNKDDYSPEQKIELMDKLIDDMATIDFTYADGNTVSSGGTYMHVEHDGETDNYYAKFGEGAVKEHKLSASEYVRVDGKWYIYDSEAKALGAEASTDEAKELNHFTFEGLFSYGLLCDNMDKVTVRDQDATAVFFGLDTDKEQCLTYHDKDGVNGDDLMEMVFGYVAGKGKNMVYTFKFPYELNTGTSWVAFNYGSVKFSDFLVE